MYLSCRLINFFNVSRQYSSAVPNRLSESQSDFDEISDEISNKGDIKRLLYQKLKLSSRQIKLLESLQLAGTGVFGDDDSGGSSREREEKTGDYDSKVEDFIRDNTKTDNNTVDENEPVRKNLKPSDLVKELDKHIVGQQDAKRAVAVSLRNRYRRHLLSKDIRDEVMPKNILMIGPTGSG